MAHYILPEKSLYQIFWNLTIIGGAIKHYSYFAVPYILAENPDISGKQAIKLSCEMMNGHKWEALKLDISFILWNILGIITLGISNFLYLNPYKIATKTEYYTRLREEAKEKAIPLSEKLNDKYLYEKASSELINETFLFLFLLYMPKLSTIRNVNRL